MKKKFKFLSVLLIATMVFGATARPTIEKVHAESDTEKTEEISEGKTLPEDKKESENNLETDSATSNLENKAAEEKTNEKKQSKENLNADSVQADEATGTNNAADTGAGAEGDETQAQDATNELHAKKLKVTFADEKGKLFSDTQIEGGRYMIRRVSDGLYFNPYYNVDSHYGTDPGTEETKFSEDRKQSKDDKPTVNPDGNAFDQAPDENGAEKEAKTYWWYDSAWHKEAVVSSTGGWVTYDTSEKWRLAWEDGSDGNYDNEPGVGNDNTNHTGVFSLGQDSQKKEYIEFPTIYTADDTEEYELVEITSAVGRGERLIAYKEEFQPMDKTVFKLSEDSTELTVKLKRKTNIQINQKFKQAPDKVPNTNSDKYAIQNSEGKYYKLDERNNSGSDWNTCTWVDSLDDATIQAWFFVDGTLNLSGLEPGNYKFITLEAPGLEDYSSESYSYNVSLPHDPVEFTVTDDTDNIQHFNVTYTLQSSLNASVQTTSGTYGVVYYRLVDSEGRYYFTGDEMDKVGEFLEDTPMKSKDVPTTFPNGEQVSIVNTWDRKESTHFELENMPDVKSYYWNGSQWVEKLYSSTGAWKAELNYSYSDGKPTDYYWQVHYMGNIYEVETRQWYNVPVGTYTLEEYSVSKSLIPQGNKTITISDTDYGYIDKNIDYKVRTRITADLESASGKYSGITSQWLVKNKATDKYLCETGGNHGKPYYVWLDDLKLAEDNKPTVNPAGDPIDTVYEGNAQNSDWWGRGNWFWDGTKWVNEIYSSTGFYQCNASNNFENGKPTSWKFSMYFNKNSSNAGRLSGFAGVQFNSYSEFYLEAGEYELTEQNVNTSVQDQNGKYISNIHFYIHTDPVELTVADSDTEKQIKLTYDTYSGFNVTSQDLQNPDDTLGSSKVIIQNEKGQYCSKSLGWTGSMAEFHDDLKLSKSSKPSSAPGGLEFGKDYWDDGSGFDIMPSIWNGSEWAGNNVASSTGAWVAEIVERERDDGVPGYRYELKWYTGDELNGVDTKELTDKKIVFPEGKYTVQSVIAPTSYTTKDGALVNQMYNNNPTIYSVTIGRNQDMQTVSIDYTRKTGSNPLPGTGSFAGMVLTVTGCISLALLLAVLTKHKYVKD